MMMIISYDHCMFLSSSVVRRPSCPSSSSSSVRPPSRPSVAVVRRRRPLSVRPSVPSVRRRPSRPSSSCKSKAACIFLQKMQNMSPTASGLFNSESTKKMLQIPWVKSKKGIRKVCFMNDLLFHKNFGPNVHVHFFSNKIMIKQ